MNFGDSAKQIVPRFGSLVDWDAPVQLPLGLASSVRNCRYTAQSIATRWGFSNRLNIGAPNSAISGLSTIRYLAQDLSGTELINLLAYTATDGNIWSAVPFQQPSVAQLSTDVLMGLANLVRVPNLNPRITQAFNRGYVALGDLTEGVAPAMVFDPAGGTVDPVSDIPVGFGWTPNYRLRVGQMISPSSFQTFGLPAAQGVWVPEQTGHLYRVTIAGETGNAQPVWPTVPNATIVSGTATLEEYTTSCASGLPDPFAPITPTSAPDAGSPILPGATVFVALTYVSANGESINDIVTAQGTLDTSKVLQWTNTTGGAVDLSVVMPAIPAALAAGGPLGVNGATGYQAYAYIVQGTPNPVQYLDPTFYAQVPGGPFVAGASATITTWPVGPSIPSVNTATIVGPGNVDTGVRWMVVIFETRTQYQTGFTNSAPIKVNVTQAGLGLLAEQIPIGPYNCIRRLCAFTVAGASAAGPYTYIDQPDVESPGFNQADIAITATTIDDNITTSATFNFTDSYLPGASDVTAYFNRIQVPPASDIFFSKTLQQVIYTGCSGYPSGHLVSDLNDAEGIEVPGSNLQVSESDGDRTVCWKEVRENQISLKENSGHAVIPNGGNPSTWNVQAIWRGMGPSGAKAAVVGVEDHNEFLIFAHRSGPYRYIGGAPQHVGREVQHVWNRINWKYGYLIVAQIDEQHREVRFAVPIDGSTTRNAVLTLNYYYGWEDPVIFAQRSGKLVPNVNARKWSVDDLSVNEIVFVPQRYDAGNVLVNVDLANEFMIAGPDGAVYTLTENQYWDENYTKQRVGYLSLWQSVPGQNPGLTITQLQGGSLSAIGNGYINVYALDDTGRKWPLSNPARNWMLMPYETQRDFGIVCANACRFGVGFDNGGVAGSWFEMHSANLRVSPTYDSRIA